jgi:hypothetical protein
MKKGLIVFIVGLCYLILLIYGIGTIYSVENPTEVKKPVQKIAVQNLEDKISIAHTDFFGSLERPQVIFDHKKHVEALIKADGKKEWDTCDSCHPWNEDKSLLSFAFPKKVAKKDKNSYMNAYHNECMDCHKKMNSQRKKSGPVTCGDCHPEKLSTLRYQYPVTEFGFEHHDKHDKKLKEKNIQDTCSYCHHIYNEELVYEKGKEWSCSYCHDIGKKTGPVLAIETKLIAKKGLGLEKVSHMRCLNCHLYFKKQEEGKIRAKDEKEAPIACVQCHTGKYKTVAELEKVPRPDSGQSEKAFIDIEKSRMKGVPFDHKSHQTQSKTCRGCHHETLNACRECHTLAGNPDGGNVTLAAAYHNISSERSCSGCHDVKKSDKKCNGCHHALFPVDARTKEPRKEICALCHSGKRELLPATKLSVKGLDTEKVKKEVEVKILEREYDPSKFPHVKIIEKMIQISNDDKLASYFHRNLQTLCEGCHHQSRSEAEARKDEPPYCRNCHSVAFDSLRLNRPRLLAAYHRQCIQCHIKMELEKPKECKECHKEKEVRPTDILSKPAETSR